MSNNQRRFADKSSGNMHYDAGNHEELSQHTPAAEDAASGNAAEPSAKKARKTRFDKKLKATGLVLLALFAASIFLTPGSSSVDKSEAAVQAAESGMSTQLPIGVRILKDDENLAGQDLTIVHASPAAETKLHIWDYAAEDGDYVQVLVDGTAIGDPFMIKNKPAVFTVPASGEIQVLGTRDGGGGITYAVHYEVNGTTYFNGTDVGDGNLYTLVRE